MAGRAIYKAVSLGLLGGCLAAALVVVSDRLEHRGAAPLEQSGSESPGTDGFWRRTADGWEDVRVWAGSGSASTIRVFEGPSSYVSGRRTNFAWGEMHPAALALVQWMLSLWGLSWTKAGDGTQPYPGWRSALAASFRASAFY